MVLRHSELAACLRTGVGRLGDPALRQAIQIDQRQEDMEARPCLRRDWLRGEALQL